MDTKKEQIKEDLENQLNKAEQNINKENSNADNNEFYADYLETVSDKEWQE